MSEYRWYHHLRGWIAGLAWDVFCWASGYPQTGFVCDWPDNPPCNATSEFRAQEDTDVE